MDNEQFIDAETPYTQENNSFEEILNRQIKNTADILSRDLSTNFYIDPETKKTYPEDRRELAINHVRTTMSLMKPFIKEPFIADIEKEEKAFKAFKDTLGEEKIMVHGVGAIKASKVFHDARSIPYLKLIIEKTEMYRKIFELLVLAYHKNKMEIASFSRE